MDVAYVRLQEKRINVDSWYLGVEYNDFAVLTSDMPRSWTFAITQIGLS